MMRMFGLGLKYCSPLHDAKVKSQFSLVVGILSASFLHDYRSQIEN